jgi:DsbC/DsbD-like thiol-disulfide interchange protein
MARPFALALAALAVAALFLPSGMARGKVDPVKVSASAGKPAGDKQVVLVELKIDKDWHVYANPTGNDDLAGAETVVQVKAGGKALTAKVKYPTGTPHTEKGIGTFKIYEDKVVIPVEFAKTDATVEISVRFQACDSARCLPPKTLKVSVK